MSQAEATLWGIRQGGRGLERYVEDFIELSHQRAAKPTPPAKMAAKPEPPAKMAAKPEPPAKMAAKPEPPAKMAAKPEPPAKMAAAPELTDPPERPQATARTEPAHPVSLVVPSLLLLIGWLMFPYVNQSRHSILLIGCCTSQYFNQSCYSVFLV
ncbi:serine threonine kinase [Labeo rohita]|uniref:Serine threonine kinase n=1 Tax=Labeo rohita TaxID=84645 RepID=A0A498LWT0_LABRO|nr:serine threonine kinase [Labeo rohita]